MGSSALFITVFLACAVEAVEVATIVLAVGTSRGWRSSTVGGLVGLAVLTLLVVALGPAIAELPLNALRLVIGALLLIMGLQWLRKAVLRAGGRKALRDESAEFERLVRDARTASGDRRGFVDDWYAFTIVFKGVVLEGLEVVFIAITFGANAGNIALAAMAAVTACLVIGMVATAIRKPMAQVPENTIKFVVGLLLCVFGTFWAAEGAGISWPGNDLAIVALAGLYAVAALALVVTLKRRAPIR